jgi:multiple sugar transport system substrate-binding protein
MKLVKISSLVLTVALLLSTFGLSQAQQTPTASNQTRQFDGVEFTLLTFVGPQVAEPLQRRAPDFEKETGAKVNIVTVPNADLYQTLLKDQSTGTNAYQAFLIAPLWMADFVNGGYLEPLDEYIKKDTKLEWDDIAPFFRDFNASYKGHQYMLPLDGDFHMVYYRTDIFEANGLKPPATWDDYLAAAKALNGKDMNGDGAGDYGSCISKKRGAQAYWWILSIAAPYIQAKGTSQGIFFNPDTMEPLVNNEGFIRALDVYKETSSYGPPNELTLDVGDTRTLFTSGRCALTLDWGDIGTLAIAEGSKVVDKTGAIITPGSKSVTDWKTGKLVACDKDTCPLAVDGVNYAPFASFGGWSGAVSAAAEPKVKEAAYAFLSYMVQPAQSGVDVTLGKTGYNPYRLSHFKNLDLWTKAGMSEPAAKNYLGAIQASLDSPNMVLDIRVPHNNEYEQVTLDTSLSQFLAGEFKTSADAAADIFKQWEALTEKYGREDQKKAYVESLSVSK